MGKRNEKVNLQRKRVRSTKESKLEAVRLLEDKSARVAAGGSGIGH